MYYTYNKISKEVYDYCITNKIVDAPLIAKWKKAGYERLCSTYVINPRNYKFGTVSICRVPKQFLAPGGYFRLLCLLF
jgi:bud site selection protein 31